MVPQDLDVVAAFLSSWSERSIASILLISPNRDQYRQFRKAYPAAKIYCSDRPAWDLNERREWRFDLIFASNVFMYSPAPRLWFENVLRSCRHFLVQDLVNRRRSTVPPYLGDDHDAIRYEFRERGVVSEFTGAFDLSVMNDRCEHFEAYAAEHTIPGSARHFIALFRGGAQNASLDRGGRIVLGLAKARMSLRRLAASAVRGFR
jgi:hypothetical protein